MGRDWEGKEKLDNIEFLCDLYWVFRAIFRFKRLSIQQGRLEKKTHTNKILIVRKYFFSLNTARYNNVKIHVIFTD